MCHNSISFEQSHGELLRQKAFDEFEISLSDAQISRFIHYGRMMLEWNEKINLTAITDPEEIIIKHFLDSLVFVKWAAKLYPAGNFNFADLGTGAGFPGIPFKILYPEVRVVLIDSLAKRLTFLNEVIKQLELTKIETCHARAEDIGRDKQFREMFDIVSARAVAELPVLLEYTIPLLKRNGRLFAAKGVEPEKEIGLAERAMKILNCQVEHLDKYSLGEKADHRCLIIIKKLKHTLPIYPRQAGKPKKSPL